MNIIEKQTELGKSLYEINTSTMKEYVNLQRSNLETFVEVNREFGSRLTDIKDVSSALNMQREYNETLWNHAKSSIEAQSELFKGAFSETQEVLKTAFTPEAEEVVAKPKAKAKAKPKAKKAKAAA